MREGCLVAYKVQFMLRAALARLEEVSPPKLTVAIQKSRYLVWVLLIQALLNDSKLAMHLENFGTSMRRESDFRELITKYCSTRLLPTLKDALGDPKYERRIAEAKFDLFARRKCSVVAWT